MTKLILGITRWTLWVVVVLFVFAGLGWGYNMGFMLAATFNVTLGDGQILGALFGVMVGLFMGAAIAGYAMLQFSINDHLAAIRKELQLGRSDALPQRPDVNL